MLLCLLVSGLRSHKSQVHEHGQLEKIWRISCNLLGTFPCHRSDSIAMDRKSEIPQVRLDAAIPLRATMSLAAEKEGM
eukprot:758439-Hanusia_phi.AAC.1